jgi:hypothetical protein
MPCSFCFTKQHSLNVTNKLWVGASEEIQSPEKISADVICGKKYDGGREKGENLREDGKMGKIKEERVKEKDK